MPIPTARSSQLGTWPPSSLDLTRADGVRSQRRKPNWRRMHRRLATLGDPGRNVRSPSALMADHPTVRWLAERTGADLAQRVGPEHRLLHRP